MTAETLMLIGGLSAFGFTVYWVRKRELREKYAIAWLSLSLLLLVVGVAPELLMAFARWAHLSFSAATLYLALTLVYCFAFSASVSLSRTHRRNLLLTQEVALLEQRVDKLEAKCENGRRSGGAPSADAASSSSIPNS